MQRQFFSGNSIEQAVLSAARHYKIEPERLAYTVRDKKHGFVNVRKRVVIVVDPDQPEVEASQIEAKEAAVSTGERLAAHEALKKSGSPSATTKDGGAAAGSSPRQSDSGRPSAGKKSAAPEDRGRDQDRGRGHQQGGRRRDRADGPSRSNDTSIETFRSSGRTWEGGGQHPEIAAFEEAIERVLDVMDLEIEYTLERGSDGFEIDFSGSDAKKLTDDDGRALKAMENILPRVVRGLVDETIPCEVDCEGFQEKRRRALEDLAQSAADKVIETGRAEMLDAMNPADRRIVHLKLVDHPAVETISEGRGYLKRVKIRRAND